MLHLHMHLPYIIATPVDSLDQEFLNPHLPADNVLYRADSCIHGPVTGSSCFKLFPGNIKPDTGHVAHADTTHHLQVFHLDTV